jgi:hypothetical protein
MHSGTRTALTAALHVFVLAGFAVAQPLYDLLSRSAGFFIAHDSTPLDLVALVALLSFGLPAAILGLEGAVAGIHRRTGWWVHCAVIGFLVLLTLLPPLKRIDAVPLAVVGGVAAVVGYARFPRLREVLTLVSPAGLLFPVLFLFFSPAYGLLFPDRASDSAKANDKTGVPVVMVVLDALPTVSLLDADREIDRGRYPNLAALADDAYWFRRATTVATTTGYAVPAIVTGRYANRRRLPTADDYPQNLFTLLSATHALNVHETVTRLCPPGLCPEPVLREPFAARLAGVVSDLRVVYLHLVLPEAFTSDLPSIGFKWKGFAEAPRETSRDTHWRFARFLDSLEQQPRGALHFIHLVTPHAPWRFLPSGKEYASAGSSATPRGLQQAGSQAVWGDDEWLATQAWQRHLLQLGNADRLIGELIARLRALRLYDPALIVIAADHGVSFRTGDAFRDATLTNLPDILNVPVLMKLPGQREAVVSDRNMETVDIVPSIAEALGVEIPWRVRGRSMLDPAAPARSGKTAFHTEEHKLRRARSGKADRAPRIAVNQAPPHLFDETLERKLATFGSGSLDDLFRIGRYADLVGRSVSDLARADGSARLEVDQAWAYEDVDPDSSVLPTLVHGRVRTDAPRPAPLHLAVSLNGVVRAVTRTDASRDGEFFALVPESALAAGVNRVEVFVIEETGTGPRLGQARGAEAQVFALGESSIRSDDGREIPLARNPARGSAHLEWHAASRVLAGRIVGSERPRILVFREGDLVYSGTTDPNFNLVLAGQASGEIRVFVLGDDAADEIEVAPGP